MKPLISLKPPVDLIEALFKRDRDNRLVLSDTERAEAVAWLRLALIDFDRLDTHLSELQRVYEEPFHYERPDLLSDRAHRLPLQEGESRVKYRDAFSEELVTKVLDEGVEGLGDAELAQLLLNPVALIDLYIKEEWAAAAMMLALGRFTSFVIRPSAAISRIRWVARLVLTLLLGGAAGVWVVRNEPSLVTRTDWHVEAFYVATGTHEPAEPGRIEIQSRLDGFVTIITLSPDGEPRLTPAADGRWIRVKRRTPIQSPPLQTSNSRPRVALIVITPTPSDAYIRSLLLNKQYTPEQIDQLHKDLERDLTAANFREIAFTSVDVSP